MTWKLATRMHVPLQLERQVGCLSTALILLLLTGCGSPGTPETTSGDEAMMSELLDELNANSGGGSESDVSDSSDFDPDLSGSDDSEISVPQRRPRMQGSRVSAVSDTSTETAKAKGERLELRLRRGDRFPLIKTIEQMLVQKSPEFPALAQTRLELTMAIQVEQEQQDAVLLSVRYSRVTYSHDLNGQRLDYDSAVHQHDVPYDVQPYAGMINNGFAFWLGRDNRIRDVVGYQEFLQRCVERVPLERRQTLLAEISGRFGDDGVANFIDDTIGLLPYDSSVDPDSATRVAPGDVWTRESRLMQPTPIYLTSTYRLVQLSPQTADIDITGRIASGETVHSDAQGHLKITGGHTLGRCTVDRATGLPLEMNLTRYISMVVTLPNGKTVPQDKQITTTIRAFPETGGSVVGASPGHAAIQPVTAIGAAPSHTASRIPTVPPATLSNHAVYPE